LKEIEPHRFHPEPTRRRSGVARNLVLDEPTILTIELPDNIGNIPSNGGRTSDVDQNGG